MLLCPVRFPRAVKFLLIVAVLRAASLPAQSTFHGDNSRSGVFPALNLSVAPATRWSFHTGGAVISSPAVSGGIVYAGSSDGNLYAVDETTGALRWKYATREPIPSSPAVANGLVYFVNYQGALIAVTADSGKRRWVFLTGGEQRFEARGIHGLTPGSQVIADPMDLFLSSPAVVDSTVYFGSSDGNVYAIDAASGVARWSFATGAVVHASPAVVNNVVYVGSWDSYFYALDARTGELKWKFKAGDDPVSYNQVGFQSSAAVVGGMVYVGCRDGHVYALDAATGRQQWAYSTSQSWVNSTPAVRDGVVYVGTSDTHRIIALDARTGSLRFVLDGKSLIFGSIALTGDWALVGTFAGRLIGVNVKSARIGWEFRTQGATADSLRVLAPDGSFRPNAPTFHNYLDMTVRLYQYFSAGAVLSSPTVSHGVIFFGSADGNIYALG